MPAATYTARTGRQNFKDLLDAAASGRPTTVTRHNLRAAVVDADRLLHMLTRLRPSRAQVVPEGEGWSVLIPGLPVAADGATLDEALDGMVEALRDYAEAWEERLRFAPNHEDNWGLVQIVDYSDDAQLKAWITGQ
jgi:prevent-host-death family protein